MFEAKVIADSISPLGVRITTMQLRYWRSIHAEFMTHRAFSRNAGSSRAIPVAKMIQQVREAAAGPLHWGANKPGMQASEQLTGEQLGRAKNLWSMAANNAADVAEWMEELGLHKQVANRILEPFQYISVIVTATEWDNFFKLRCHKDAQPEMQYLATIMRAAREASTPRLLEFGQWHMPYIRDAEQDVLTEDQMIRASVARCARVSYNTHDGKLPDLDKDLALHDQLVVATPMHASPAEHQACPYGSKKFMRNFRGWMQYRVFLENTGRNDYAG